jgi:hypothetical protein
VPYRGASFGRPMHRSFARLHYRKHPVRTIFRERAVVPSFAV